VGCGEEANEQVQRIMADFPVWNTEVVNELLRWGATPKLHRVLEVDPSRGPFGMARCKFIQGDGTEVEGIWISLLYVRNNYGEIYRQFGEGVCTPATYRSA
jgi:hypothetical protein